MKGVFDSPTRPSFRSPSEITPRSLLDHSWITPGSLLDYSWIKSNTSSIAEELCFDVR